MRSSLLGGIGVVILSMAVTAVGAETVAQPDRPRASLTAPAPGTLPSARLIPARQRGASLRSGVPSSSVQGSAWRADNTPVSKALLRLRNVITGKLQGTTVADDGGLFTFGGVPEGTYVIEMVTQAGSILMVGQTFTVTAGETVATFLRLGPKVPWFNGFFHNAAAAVASSAASTGVTAIAPEEIPPVSAAR